MRNAGQGAGSPAPPVAGREGLAYPGPQEMVSDPPLPSNSVQTVLQPDLEPLPLLDPSLALPNAVLMAAAGPLPPEEEAETETGEPAEPESTAPEERTPVSESTAEPVPESLEEPQPVAEVDPADATPQILKVAWKGGRTWINYCK